MRTAKGVAVLGSTGSVGRNALDVIAKFPKRFRVTALCAGKNVAELAEQARRFRPPVVCLSEKVAVSRLGRLPAGTRVLYGEEGMSEVACAGGTDIVLAAAAGVTSIRPVIGAARKGKRIALANKELLVMAGKFLVGGGNSSRRQRALRGIPGDRGAQEGGYLPDHSHGLGGTFP